MKINGRIVALTALLAGNLTAAPFVALGDNAELFLTASVDVKVDDNIYLRNTNEADDTILTFSPGLDLVFGRNAATSGNVFYRHDILRYSDNSVQDTDLANFGFNSLYSNGKTKFDAGVSYAETAQNDAATPGFIVPRDITTARALAEFGLTEKTSLGAGARYEKSDFSVGGGYRDSSNFSVPLDVYFEYSPKLELSAGYRYRSNDVSGAGNLDSNDHFLSIGARGEFTPKMSGQIRVGYAKRNFDAATGDEDTFGLDANLTLAATAKTAIRFNVSNDFGVSALGESTDNFLFSASVNSRVDDQWSWQAGLAFRAVDYPTRADDYFEGNVGVRYTYSSFVNFAAGYTHRKNDSSLTTNDFSNNVFSLTANLRY